MHCRRHHRKTERCVDTCDYREGTDAANKVVRNGHSRTREPGRIQFPCWDRVKVGKNRSAVQTRYRVLRFRPRRLPCVAVPDIKKISVLADEWSRLAKAGTGPRSIIRSTKRGMGTVAGPVVSASRREIKETGPGTRCRSSKTTQTRENN